jgi:hypothetical protein
MFNFMITRGIARFQKEEEIVGVKGFETGWIV